MAKNLGTKKIGAGWADWALASLAAMPALVYLIFYYDLRAYFHAATWHYTGWTGFGFLLPVLAAFLIPLALMGFGDLIRAAMGIEAERGIGLLTLDAGLGLAGICFIGWGAALAGLAGTEVIIAVDIFILGLALPRCIKLLRNNMLGRAADFFRNRSRLELFLMALAALMAVLILIRALAPPIEVDELSDHLVIAKKTLQVSALPFMPYRNYTYFPALFQMGFVMLLPFGAQACRLLHFLAAMTVALELFRFGRDMGGGEGGIWAAAFFFTIPIAVWVAATAFTDMAWILFALLGIRYAVMEEFKPALSGLFFGCAIMTKYVAGGVWLGTVLVLLPIVWRTKNKTPGAKAASLALWCLIPALMFAPWGIRNFLIAGNPFYPFVGAASGSAPASPQFLREYNHFMAGYGPGRGLSQLVRFPLHLTFWGDMLFERGAYDPRFLVGPLPLLLSPLFLVGLLSSAKARRLGFIVAVTFACWWLSFHVERFLILPLLVYLAVAAGGMVVVGRKFKATAWVFKILAAAVVLMSAVVLCLDLGAYAPSALGFMDRDTCVGLNRSVHVMVMTINERDDVGKLAMVLQTDEFYMEPPAVWINAANGFALDMGRIDDAEQALERLRKMGVTHILVNNYRLGYFNRLSSPYQKKFGTVIRDLLASHGVKPVLTWREFSLYRVLNSKREDE